MVNVNPLLREQILNMQLFIMDKFGDIDCEDQVVPVESG